MTTVRDTGSESEAVDVNFSQQCDEIEALAAIYGDDFVVMDTEHRIYEVRVSSELDSWWSATLQVLLPPQYPSKVPPVFEIHSAWMSDADKFEITDSLYNIFRENNGEIVLYQWVENLREFVNNKAMESKETQKLQSGAKKVELEEEEEEEEEENSSSGSVDVIENGIHYFTIYGPQSGDDKDPGGSNECPEILHGEPFTDRKSTFQAHLAHVVTTDQVKQVLGDLKKNRKIANATHNIMAYRIYHEDTDTYALDCDDDGESCAGGRLAHLLQILSIRDVVVVVTRWYGGVLLGPDRFKHINNCARELLKAAGLLENKVLPAQKEGKAKKSRVKVHKHKYT